MFQFREDKQNWKIPFFIIWGGQAFSLLGSNLVHFALVWWMTEKTGSAVVLATGTFINMIPQIVLGPFCGALVDRWNRRKIMILADTSIALATLALVFLFWQNAVQLWQVFTLLFIRALGGTFHWSAMQASTTLMIPEKQLSRIAGMNQTLHGVVNLAAPPLGALMLASLPMFSVLSVDIFTALLAITPLLFILVPQPANSSTQKIQSYKEIIGDVKIGFRYVIEWRGLFYILILAAVLNFLLAPLSTYMPLLVTEHFQGGVWQVGWIETAWGMGVIFGGLLLSVWGGFKKRIYTSLAGVAFLGLGVGIVGVAPQDVFWMALIGMGITGVMYPIINGPFMAIIQSNVEPEMQGRVFSLVNSFCGAMMPLSMVVSAPFVENLGPQPWYFASAILCMVLVVAGFSIRDMREIESHHQAKTNIPNLETVQSTASD